MHPIGQITASGKTIPCICLARLVRFQPVPSLKNFREGFNTRLSLCPSETNCGQHRESRGCVFLLRNSPLRLHATSGWKPQRLESSASHLTGALFTCRHLLHYHWSSELSFAYLNVFALQITSDVWAGACSSPLVCPYSLPWLRMELSWWLTWVCHRGSN